MAEDQTGQRKEMRAPWTKIFTAFKVALDVKKLLLAAGGILAMAAGWWLLAFIFFSLDHNKPNPGEYLADHRTVEEKDDAWAAFKVARKRWNLLYELAGPTSANPKDVEKIDAGDIAQTWPEYEEITKSDKLDVKWLPIIGFIKPHGRLRTWPWFEYRGENPYLLVTDAIKTTGTEGAAAPPQISGAYVLRTELLVLIEPLVKFLSPLAYVFDERAGALVRIYLLCVILWTLAVWGFFGGAITRMAIVQIARNEKITMRDALRFARERFVSYFAAPVIPLVILGFLTVCLIIFGLFSGLIPVVGDILIAGLLWPIVLVIGLIMAVVLVGLIGWPLMNPTISAEGSDSFDALSRSYSYVYQAPWHYLWYSIVALVYGAVLVFFVGLMGSLMVYLGEWAVSEAPFLASRNPASDREPTYLFIDAPTSFGWRNLLLRGSQHAEPREVITPNGDRAIAYEMSDKYIENMKSWNYIGAFLVSVWLYLLFLLVVGFGYSYFWTASSIIYLLMRHKVDDTDLDEIHLEEEETEEPFAKDMAPAAPAAPKAAATTGTGNVTMVEAPALRPAAVITPGQTMPAPGESPIVENKPAGDGTPPPPNP